MQKANDYSFKGLCSNYLKEKEMPKLKEIDINYDQIRDLVYQLEFEKKMALIKDVVKDKSYQNDFYRFTESLIKKYNIPEMDESELDTLLHG